MTHSSRSHKPSGHATLATAHTLFTSRHPQANLLTFVTRHSGELIARRTASPAQATSSPLNAADPGPISLDFPAASLVTLESGHRRRAKIVDAVLRAVQGLGESAIVRVAWWDGQRSPVVELPAGTDLQNLHVSPTPLVSDFLPSSAVLSQMFLTLISGLRARSARLSS